MEIISRGKNAYDDGSVVFTCPKCGCKFRAHPDEYYKDSSYYSDSGTFLTYSFTHHCTVWYHANCPECHKMCVESRDEGNTYYYTVSCDGYDKITTDHITVNCSLQGDESKCE